jgi:hypothetical protein
MELFESSDLTLLGFCLWSWRNNEAYKRYVDTPDDLLARILDAAAHKKIREDQFRPTTIDHPTQLAKCIEVGVGNFFSPRHLLLTVINLSFQCNEFII